MVFMQCIMCLFVYWKQGLEKSCLVFQDKFFLLLHGYGPATPFLLTKLNSCHAICAISLLVSLSSAFLLHSQIFV